MDYRVANVQLFQRPLLYWGLKCSGLKDYNNAFCVVYYRVTFSTTATMRSMYWTKVERFQRLQLYVLCIGLSCSIFKNYNYAFYVVDFCVAVSKTTTVCFV